MVRRTVDHFDLAQICKSGQCFRMYQESENVYSVIAGNRKIKVSQQGTTVDFFCMEDEFERFWSHYFDLENDYAAYIERINPSDAYLVRAAAFGSGVRILNQDLWEMIVSFLISQQNNIVRIRRCIENICTGYGEQMEDAQGERYYAFPRPEALAVLGEDDLKACNLGYRSKYVVRTAQAIASGEIDLEAIGHMTYQDAKEELLNLFGVGEKVADCICLFALHHLQAFPVDTHIRQALQAHYKRGFPRRRYQGIQGVLQQYIFYYELCGPSKEPRKTENEQIGKLKINKNEILRS